MSWFSKSLQKARHPIKRVCWLGCLSLQLSSPSLWLQRTLVFLYFSELSTQEDFWQWPWQEVPLCWSSGSLWGLVPSRPLTGLPIGVSTPTLPLPERGSFSQDTLPVPGVIQRGWTQATLTHAPFLPLSSCGACMMGSWGPGGTQHIAASLQLSYTVEDIQRATKIKGFQRRTKAF